MVESGRVCWVGIARVEALGGRGRARPMGGVEGLVTASEENGRERYDPAGRETW